MEKRVLICNLFDFPPSSVCIKVKAVLADFGDLIAIGWKKFVEDTEQIRARASNVKWGNAQRHILKELIRMDNLKEFSDKKDMIETLRKAYSIPILKGKLNNELHKIQKSDMSDSEIIQHLSQLYLNYNLQNQIKQNEEESKSPRILYSKYVEIKFD